MTDTAQLSALATLAGILAPAHLLSYAALLGTQLYQSFIVTKIAFRALPRSSFTTLQKCLFPAYFRVQSALLVVTALTAPLPMWGNGAVPSGAPAMSSPVIWVPAVVAGVTSALNLMRYGPATQRAMIDRFEQATKDAEHRQLLSSSVLEQSQDDEMTPQMRECNRRFSRAHAMSIHLNLMTVLATLWYGTVLGMRLRFNE